MFYQIDLLKISSGNHNTWQARSIGPFSNEAEMLESLFSVFALLPFGLRMRFSFPDTPASSTVRAPDAAYHEISALLKNL